MGKALKSSGWGNGIVDVVLGLFFPTPKESWNLDLITLLMKEQDEFEAGILVNYWQACIAPSNVHDKLRKPVVFSILVLELFFECFALIQLFYFVTGGVSSFKK